MSSQTSIILLNKPAGATPLQMIVRFKQQYPEYKNVTLGYAGRLDPMAEGLLLILVGERNKKRKEIERLKKSYTFDVLFGVATDSYDILGTVIDICLPCLVEKSPIKQLVPSFIGKQRQAYPPYSSPRVQGHPLFWWARAGRLDEITIPEKEIEVYDFRLTKLKTVAFSSLQHSIEERILLVKGEFRQQEILAEWEALFRKQGHNLVTLASFTLTCSSGTYIRSIAQSLGQKLGYPALAFSIRRTAVGPFRLEQVQSLD